MCECVCVCVCECACVSVCVSVCVCNPNSSIGLLLCYDRIYQLLREHFTKHHQKDF